MSKGKTYKFHGSEFKASTGFGTTKAITGATNASPCVLTVVAHGIVDHGVVKVAGVGGMIELDQDLYAVEVLSVDTLRLIDVDAINYGVFTSGGTIAPAVFTAHCEQTNYSFGTGQTPMIEDEMVCGVSIQPGAPRMGSINMTFKSAENAFQDALEAAHRANAKMAFRVKPAGMSRTRYDIGWVGEINETGAVGATWDGSTTITLSAHRAKVDA